MFLKESGQNRIQYIKSISFELLGDTINRNQAAELYQCTNLKKLGINLSQGFMGLDAKNPLQGGGVAKLRGIRGCQEVRVNRRLPPMYKTVPWITRLEKFENVLKEELCRERSPLDKLRPENLAQAQENKEKRKL